MRPATTAWLANLRANAEAPGNDLVLLRGPKGAVVFTPNEIVGKSDEELLAFVAGRLTEQ
jgi:hypothetical protein